MTNELLMDFSDYAKSAGKSRQYIHKLYRQGRLKKALVKDQETGKIMINKKIADNVLLGIKPAVKNNEIVYNIQPEDADILSASLDEAKRFKICYEAISEKNNVHKERGLLVPQAEVDKQALTSALIFRDKILSIPTRVAPMLVGKTSIFEIKNILIEYITTVLEGISNINDSNFLKEVSE